MEAPRIACAIGGAGASPTSDTVSGSAHFRREISAEDSSSRSARASKPAAGVQVFSGEFDDEGVFVYQAFNDAIADWALAHQRFGGPHFNPARMTWIKPSFAWVLYRSGYARKHNQTRILKVKVRHAALAALLAECDCKTGGGGSKGRVQWDPARDLLAGEDREPRRMARTRAIQIGLKGMLSQAYVASVLSIADVTGLAHRVRVAHASKEKDAMVPLYSDLPVERDYVPHCAPAVLAALGMAPGDTAAEVGRIGRGKAV